MNKLVWLALACGGDKVDQIPDAPFADAGPDAGCTETFDDGTGPRQVFINGVSTFGSAGTVHLCATTYGTVMTITADLHVVGVARDLTVLDAQQGGPVISVSNNATVTLEDLTLQDGRATHVIDNLTAGGIVFCDTANLTMKRVVVTGGNAQLGGGVAETNCTLAISDAQITGNNAQSDGGGIVLSRSGSASLTRVTLGGDSTSGDGGGIAVLGPASLTIDQSDISLDTGTGGGLWDEGSVTCHASAIHQNSSFGVELAGSGTFTAQSCDFGTAGSDANLPNAISTGSATFDFGNGATFACSVATGCQ